MKLLATAIALLLTLLAAPARAQDIASGSITVHTVEILDSNMYHPDYSTNATVTRSTNPNIPKGSIARLTLVRDPNTKIFSVLVVGIVLNGAFLPAGSGPATLPGGLGNKTGNAFKMRGDGHIPSLSGGTVFLPANTNINFDLAPPAPPQQ